MTNSKRLLGVVLAITAALLWGIQGPVSQFLFQDNVLSPEWLMGVKMTIAGVLILLYVSFQPHVIPTAIWHDRRDAIHLVIYTILGLAAVQYMYFLTIQASNAGTATILQSLGTVMIVLYAIFIEHKNPSRAELLAVLVALLGTWLLVTKGDLTHLAITKQALFFGFLLALSGATQTLMPIKLIAKYTTLVVLGWAMLMGGLLFSVIHPFWIGAPTMNLSTILGVGFIVLFGTVLSYLCFNTSLTLISPTSAGLLDTFEPLAATIGAVLFLNTTFNAAEIGGGLLILSTVFILAGGNVLAKRHAKRLTSVNSKTTDE